MLKVGTFFSGVGSPEQALKDLNIPHEVEWAAEWDKYARTTYAANHECKVMYEDVTKIDYNTLSNIDLYIAGFPCQSFSLAGKRLGFDEVRGTLFFNCAELIKVKQPKYFILENVKGLLSHDKAKGSKHPIGKTFSTIINLLGSNINGQDNSMFAFDDCLGYNIHYKVLNAKDFGIPQNRERVFIIGIRPDLPNTFRFPKGFPLTKRLKDILETDVPEKYYLSDKMLNYLTSRSDNFNGGKVNYKSGEDVASCINASSKSLDISDNILVVNDNGILRQNSIATAIDANYWKGMDNHAQRTMVQEPLCAAMRGRSVENPSDRTTGIELEQRLEINGNGTSNTLTSVQKDNLVVEPIRVSEATQKGYAEAYEGDSINLSVPGSKTRRGRVGVAQTLDTSCNQAVVVGEFEGVITHYGFKDKAPTFHEISPTLKAQSHGHEPMVSQNYRIRRLTPREVTRLMDFPDTFDISKCSETQIYKQMGNSIVRACLIAIYKNLLPIKND